MREGGKQGWSWREEVRQGGSEGGREAGMELEGQNNLHNIMTKENSMYDKPIRHI